MPSSDPDQKKPVDEQAAQTFTQRVERLQERVRKMRVVSGRSHDKAFMDEVWGKDSGDAGGWDFEALRDAIDNGLNICPSILANQVFAELWARSGAKS